MRIGKVCGSVWATKKNEHLSGSKLLIVKVGNEKYVATDTLGAGIGDTVLLIFGSSARHITSIMTDAAVCGIIDKIDCDLKENEYEYQ